jgi:hypothetical protein
LNTGENILASAGESGIEGVDRSFNIQPSNAADPDSGAAFSVREPAEERVAASATIGAVGLAASGPLSTVTRGAAGRTGSAARAAGGTARRELLDFEGVDRGQGDLTFGSGRTRDPSGSDSGGSGDDPGGVNPGSGGDPRDSISSTIGRPRADAATRIRRRSAGARRGH